MAKSDRLVIIGMGRSGTSAVASGLIQLGAFGGEEKARLKGDRGNPDGYFELGPFADLNDQIRSSLGMKYNICQNCPEDWESYENIEAHLSELVELLGSTFNGHQRWLLKDPRISLLMPVYKEAFRRLKLKPTFIICVRNPLDSSASFSKKFGLPETWALAMWLQHTLTALKETEGSPFHVIPYESFLESPTETLGKVVAGVKGWKPTDSAWGQVAQLPRQDWNHGEGTQDLLADLRPAIIRESYDLCLRISKGPHEAWAKEIDPLWAEFNAWWHLPPYDRLLASRVVLSSQVQGAEATFEQIYVPRRKSQTVELTYEADPRAWVEVQITDWPGIFLLKDVHCLDASGSRMTVEIERAGDIACVPHPEGQIWTVPRVGNHFRFSAPPKGVKISITFSSIADPPEASRVASEAWIECLALRQRVAELEAALRSRR